MELFGRGADEDRVVSRLGSRRLVTLTGPGGIGKSALARRVVARLGPGFDRGAFEIDLTRVDHGEAVAGAFASQLGYPDLDALLNTPDNRSVLLMVDNCEHVLDQAATIVVSILDQLPSFTVLTTSRSPLDVPAESIVALGPLATSDPHAIDLESPALALLLERAGDHGVELDPAVHGRIAADIVRRLDGVPLAIELAAAQLRSKTGEEIASDLETRIHALARPRFRGRPEHRSVGELIEWSYSLLDAEAADILDNLSVFAGPFTAAMAGAVAAPGRSTDDVRRVLDDLVNASLVDRPGSSGDGWFRLLHPIRAVARHRLTNGGRQLEVESRHVDHTVDMAVDIIVRGNTGWHADLLSDLLAMFDNVFAAVLWALEHDRDGHRAEVLVAVLWGVVHQAHVPEVARIGEAVLERWPDSNGPNRSDAAATVATCRNLLGDHKGAIELARSTLDAHSGSGFAPATLQRVLAQAHRARFDTETAREYFQAGAEAAEVADMGGLAMELWTDYGALVAELGDLDGGLAAIDKALARARENDAMINVAWCLVARGNALLGAVRTNPHAAPTTNVDPSAGTTLDEARQSLEQAVDLSRSIQYPAGLACALRGLAEIHLSAGDRRRAAQALLEVLAILQTNGNLVEMRMVLDGAALVLEDVPGSSWLDLAATAASLPITNVATPMEIGVLERAESTGQVLTRRDAFIVSRGELQEVVDRTDDPITLSDTTDQTKETSADFVREGEVWRIDYGGRTIRLRRSKGLRDLARLLAEPDREIHVLDLTGAPTTGQSALPVIDDQARRSYEDRVRELQADIESAEADHDIGRAERLRVEMDTLVDQLAAGLGLGGRRRSTGGDAERARSAVTRRIRDTIRRIESEHPALGRHLEVSIQTGVFCAYRPDGETCWEVSP